MSLSTCCLPTKLNSQKNGFILVQVCIILDAQFNEEKNGRRISHFPLSLKVLTFRTLIFRILVGLKTKVSTVLFNRNPKKKKRNKLNFGSNFKKDPLLAAIRHLLTYRDFSYVRNFSYVAFFHYFSILLEMFKKCHFSF